MADSLLDQLKALVTPEIVARVGGALGESEENVEKGFGAAAPALLSGLVSRATEGQGAERILSLVNDTDNDGSILSSTESLLGDAVATMPLHGLGQTLMGGLFSGKSEEVAEGIAQESGLQKGSALKILGFLSPLLLGLLGKNLGPGAAPTALLGLVTAQKDSILGSLTGGLTQRLGGVVNLGALSGTAEATVSTAASSVVGGLGSIAVDAAPIIPPPVADVPTLVVVENPVVEPAIMEAPVVETPIVEPVVVEVVEPVAEPIADVAPVAFSIPEAPEALEEPGESVAAIVAPVELPEPTVPEAEPAAFTIEPPVFTPVESVDEVAAIVPELPAAEITEDIAIPEPAVFEPPSEVEVEVEAPVFSKEPVVVAPEVSEQVEPAVEAAGEVAAEAVVAPETEPVEGSPLEAAVEEAVSAARESLYEASDHLSGSAANVMLKPEPRAGMPKFLVPLIAVLALGATAYYFLKVRPAAGAGAPKPTVEMALPNGRAIKVIQGGTEEKLVAFLKDAGKPADETTWFNFDRLSFAVGKASLMPESRPQIENLVAILNAFPNTNVKIGGYTDNTGVPEANQKLSASRATAVMKAITGRDIALNRIQAEGYGDQNPACPANDTEDCKKQNRRVALLVTKK